MDVIALTRQLGAAIQKEEAYLAYNEARLANESDEALNAKIGEFNLIRMSLTNELQKPAEEKSQSKVEALNKQLQDLYTEIMSNDNMQKFNAAKQEMDKLTHKITGIIAMCIEGEDPETCEVPDECSGSCETCGGCH